METNEDPKTVVCQFCNSIEFACKNEAEASKCDQSIAVLDDETFDPNSENMLVMFYAEFSGPSQVALKNLKEAKADIPYPCYVFDIDENIKVPEKYGVKGVPEFIFFVDGEPTKPIVGMLDIEAIKEIVK